MEFNPNKPSRVVTDTKPSFDPSKASKIISNDNISVYSKQHGTIANTNINDATKVDYMSDTQINKTPRENYFGMVKTGTIDDIKSGLKELGRGAANVTVSSLQSLKRFGMEIGAKAEIRKQAFREGKTKEEAEIEVSKWENDIAFEVGEIAKTNEKYREKLGIARKEGDGFVYDLGSGLAQLGVSILSRSPTLMAGFFGVTQQQEISEEVFANLKDAEKANRIGTFVAIPTAALEFVGLDNLMKTFKGNSIIRNMIRASLVEGSQEIAQQAVEETITQKYGGREKSIYETLQDIGYAGLLGFILGGGVSGAMNLATAKAKEKGFKDKKKVEDIVNNINNNEQLKQETVETLKRQNDNTTHYGNNIDNGIAEVQKAINEKKEQYKGKTLSQVLVEEARGENTIFTEDNLYSTLQDYDDAIADLNKLKKPKSLVQFINENGGIYDEGGDLQALDIRKKAPFLLRKEKVNKNGQLVTPDDVGLRLYEAGYFDKRPTVNELLDAIDNELQGRNIYTAEGYDLETQRGELENFINSIDREIDINKIRQLKKLSPTERNRPALLEEAIKDENVLNEIAQKQELEAINRDVEQNISNIVAKKNGNNQGFFNRTSIVIKDGITNIKDGFDSITRPVSSVIEKMSPELWIKLDRYLYQTGIEQKKSFEKIKPFNDKLVKIGKKNKQDYYTIDFLLKNISAKKENADIGKAYKKRLDEYLKKYDLQNEFNSIREELNRIYAELGDVGLEVGFLQDYIPRMVDPKKKVDFLSYLEGTEEYSEIMRTLKQEKFFQEMTLEERAKFVNNFLRGFIPKDVITLSRIGNIKYERAVQELDADLNEFYLDTTDALITYINATTKLIEQKKIFGTEKKDVSTLRTLIKRKRTQLDKSLGTEKEQKIRNDLKLLEEQLELIQDGRLLDSVGQIVYELASEQKLTANEEKILKRTLSGIINFKQSPKGIILAKNLTYASTLGNVRNAITQIADLGFSIYNNGYISTIQSISKKKVSVKDLGIDNIMLELSTQDGLSKWIDREFKLTGLHKIDLFGKNTFINSLWISTNKKLKAENKKINDELNFIFGDKSGQVKKDMLANNYTEDIGFYLYHKLGEIQPINLASMPLAYLENPSARLLYALKTFALKQLDFTRKQILSKIKTEPLTALRNAVRLQIALMLMGATKDVIKSFWSDEDLDMNEVLLNNILIYNLIGRYTFKTAEQRGVGSAVINFVTPPLAGIADKIQKGKFLDIVPFGRDIKPIKEKL